MNNFVSRILRVLASLKLAIVLLVLLCLLMALATGLEKLHGAMFAQWTIYDSPFFVVLFVLLFINILASALVRLPVRKKQTGFFIIHLGILVLLLGTLVSRLWGSEGSIELTPNEPTTTFTTNDPTLSVYFLNVQDDTVIQINKSLPKKIYGLRSSKNNTVLVDDFLITVTDFNPFADPHNVEKMLLPRGEKESIMSAHVLVTRLSDDSTLEDTWLTNAHPAHVALSVTQMCVIVLSHAKQELPFTLTLNSFEVGMDPDSGTPSAYTSRVTITDDDGQHDAIISMNKPLNIEGFRFFQSSYFGLDDGALGSILTVNKDFGRLAKYLGSGLLVLGSLIHLFFRKKT